MKKILLLLLPLIGIQLQSAAQHKAIPPAKLSPRTQLYLANGAQEQSGYVYKQNAAGQRFVSALIQAGQGIDESRIHQLGAFIGTKAGNVWTVQIPVAQVAAFTNIQGIDYVQLDEPVFPALDSVRKVTHADSVQDGINLPKHFSGKDVVMGIIDIGFDYSHPLFTDTLGAAYRIKRVWEQRTTTGTPPTGFSYGSELTSTPAMLAAMTDNPTQSHGTHVSGIAAGSGIGSSTGDNRFRGLAFGTDVVLVGITPPPGQWTNTGLSDIIDGMKYIFDYATSVGKPAVANLSWGCTIGSHDGLSLFSKACDALTGAGKIFVCSAGNTGTDAIHLQKIFTPADTIVHTFVTFDTYLATRKTWIDVWGDSSKIFCLAATLSSGGISGNTTNFICLDNTVHNTYLIGAAGDTCFLNITTATADINGKPRIFLNIYNKAADALFLSVKATNGKINMWEGYVENSSGYYGALTNGGTSWAKAGDVGMTISDFSATHSAIAVGAWVARNAFLNISGAPQSYANYPRGRLASFSSHGPAVDSSIKPDISAPGFAVASGINSYDASWSSTGSNYASVFSTFQKNSRTYSYAMLSGTSMSGPVVSGIAALMLEANPMLTPQQIKTIMAETAITDTYTGTIPAAGNNTWGHGKVNAYAAVRRVVHDLGIDNVIGKTIKWSLYPNPSNGVYTLDCTTDKAETATIEVSDVTGKIILRQPWKMMVGKNTCTVNTGNIAKGLYVTRLVTSQGMAGVKVIIE